MYGTNTNASGSDPIGLTASSGSTSSSSGLNASTASAQSSVAISTSTGNTRSNTEFEQKRFHDENCSNPTAGGSLNSDANPTARGNFNSGANCSNPTAGGSFNSGTNSGGNGNGQALPDMSRNNDVSNSNQPVSNSIPSSQALPDMSLNKTASTSNHPLSTAVVRQLIEESLMDLINLLTSHLTMVLNPIVADTNAKYE
ncbi:hypothetical protein PIB30_011226 [Stylosanthes scabra]|uniref:Uncharacterized protein n=1 Tax=Stylosanthes scabra TaxID=79078 RepID=A0ABU6T737_9FABA|nr:hypothetical protein [Stylosanthes scabra]